MRTPQGEYIGYLSATVLVLGFSGACGTMFGGAVTIENIPRSGGTTGSGNYSTEASGCSCS